MLRGEGDLDRAIVTGSLFSNAHPAPADDDSMRIVFDDGTKILYDPAQRHLSATVTGGGATIEADDITLIGRVTIMGDVEVRGSINATGDVVGGGKSLPPPCAR